MNHTQIALPVEVRPEEVAREKTFHGALNLCAKLGGFDLDKQLQDALGTDKAQLSRWLSGQAMPTWENLRKFMDTCGNDAPVLWMAQQCGYDLNSFRKRETELQRQLREANEQIVALRRVLYNGHQLAA